MPLSLGKILVKPIKYKEIIAYTNIHLDIFMANIRPLIIFVFYMHSYNTCVFKCCFKQFRRSLLKNEHVIDLMWKINFVAY